MIKPSLATHPTQPSHPAMPPAKVLTDLTKMPSQMEPTIEYMVFRFHRFAGGKFYLTNGSFHRKRVSWVLGKSKRLSGCGQNNDMTWICAEMAKWALRIPFIRASSPWRTMTVHMQQKGKKCAVHFSQRVTSGISAHSCSYEDFMSRLRPLENVQIKSHPHSTRERKAK